MNSAGARILAELNGPKPSPASTQPEKNTGGKSPRWWGVFRGFIGNHLHRVSPAAASVWFALFAFSDNSVARIGIAQLVTVTGQSDRNVKYRIQELIAAGLVRVETRGRRNQGTNRYRLLSTGNPLPVDAILNGQPIAHSMRQPIAPFSRENRRGGRLSAAAASEGSMRR